MGFEKRGLPPKPYERGKEWTPDAPICEGCQANFTLLNRKHHCRRCGGLFCNNCTLDRLYLRGQGDAPARVCKPCKEFEDAAKLEKYGKSKTPRGMSKSSIRKDDGTAALLKELLEKPHDKVVNVESIVASVADYDRDGDRERLASAEGKALTSPTRLHEQAQEERKRYSALKKQGNETEALKAFKRAKELERQAEALDKEIKHQRRVSAGSSSALANKSNPNKEDPESPDAISRRKSEPRENSKKRRALSQDEEKEKESATEKDNLLHELKALGWSDKDIREADKKPAAKSEEQLLAELAAEVRSKSDREASSAVAPGANGEMSMQIMVHKRQAVALKREGRLAEAKDELRKAKILEKQAEEMALLGQAEGEDEASDDDEYLALIRGLEREEKTKGNAGKKGASSQDLPEDFSIFTSFGDDDDADVEVDDNDLDDPEIAAALRAMGFEEDNVSGLGSRVSKPQSRVTKTTTATTVPDLKQQILAQKRKAVALKREGKLAEARAELGEAKNLQEQLENVMSSSVVAQAPALKVSEPTSDGKIEENEESAENVEVTDQDMRDPDMMAALRAVGFGDDEPPPSVSKPEPVDEASLTQQILGMKRQALSLKREGRRDEALESLRRAKVLEQQLQDLQAASQRQEETPTIIKQSREARRGAQALPALSGLPDLNDEGEEEEVEVDNADLVDPDIAAALAAVGWQEDPAELVVEDPKKDDGAAVVSDPMPANQISAGELQPPQEAETKKVETVQAEMNESESISGAPTKSTSPLTPTRVFSSKKDLQVELLGRKRRALALKREGKSEEARIELREAKIIEAQLSELEKGLAAVIPPTVVAEKSPTVAVQAAHLPPQQAPKHIVMQEPGPARPTYLDDELVDEVEVTDNDMQDPAMLAALSALEKEGNGPSKLTPRVGEKEPTGGNSNPLGVQAPTGKGGDTMGSLLEFDWGIPRGRAKKTDQTKGSLSNVLPPLPQAPRNPPERPTPTSRPTTDATVNVHPATPNLQQEILALKRKAVALKREGKTGEAREELRKAKLLEKQSAAQQDSQEVVFTSTSNPVAGTDSASSHSKIEDVSSIASASPSRPEPSSVPVKTSPPSKSPGHKEEMQKQVRQTKDRMKLQQESLAHKRKAMGLRRQGKSEEADAEYELAKELEKQMEDLDPVHGKEDLGDVAGVEDLLDPQLLAALKGLGFKEGDLTGPPVTAPTGATGQPRSSDVGSSSRSSAVATSKPASIGALEAEKKQLEEQIRAQKLQAVQLKRAGKQGEALEKLRGAKVLEKRLLTLTS